VYTRRVVGTDAVTVTVLTLYLVRWVVGVGSEIGTLTEGVRGSVVVMVLLLVEICLLHFVGGTVGTVLLDGVRGGSDVRVGGDVRVGRVVGSGGSVRSVLLVGSGVRLGRVVGSGGSVGLVLLVVGNGSVGRVLVGPLPGPPHAKVLKTVVVDAKTERVTL
jgi:hypothetical protein